VYFLQSSLLLVRTVPGGLPVFVSQLFQHTSNIAGLSPTAVECVLHGVTLFELYYLYMFVPLGLLVLCGVVFGIGKLIQCRPGVRLQHWGARCGYMALHMVQLAYFDVVVKVLCAFVQEVIFADCILMCLRCF